MTYDPYKLAGVDLPAEHDFSKAAGVMCRSTFNNSPYIRVSEPTGNFRGPRYFDIIEPARNVCQLDGSMDGCGTKPILSVAAKSQMTAGYDLGAMLFMDATRFGRLPQVVMDELSVRKLGDNDTDLNNAHRRILFGLTQACNDAHVVLFRGETAQSGACVSGDDPNSEFSFLFCGAVFTLRHPQLDILGDRLRPGQPIMALYEPSSACNGISLIRSGLKIRYGDDWFNEPAAQEDIALAAEPCTLYDPFLNKMNGWYDGFKPLIRISAIAHITGGGLEEKLGRDILFPRGLSAELTNLHDPPEIFRKVKEWVESQATEPVSNETLYRTFACGQRALAVLEDVADEADFVAAAKDLGIIAKRCGTVTREDEPTLTVVSKFDGETFHYCATPKGA